MCITKFARSITLLMNLGGMAKASKLYQGAHLPPQPYQATCHISDGYVEHLSSGLAIDLS